MTTAERIAELRQEFYEQFELSHAGLDEVDYGKIGELFVHIDSLTAQLSTLREALEWYGDKKNHAIQQDGGTSPFQSKVAIDSGSRARQALQMLGGKEK